LVHPFEQVFEAIEPVAPEHAVPTHPIDEGSESFWLGAVVGFSPAAVAHQTSQLERAQMFRHRRLRHAGKVSQRMDGLFALAAKSFEDRPTPWIAQGFENGVGWACIPNS
jgi:hypothetical protein